MAVSEGHDDAELKRLTPTNTELMELAERHPPPAEWYEEDFDNEG